MQANRRTCLTIMKAKSRREKYVAAHAQFGQGRVGQIAAALAAAQSCVMRIKPSLRRGLFYGRFVIGVEPAKTQ